MSLWHAIKGAKRYAEAVATGDSADGITRAARASVCGKCPERREYRVPLLSLSAAFCGEAFKETATTCGCLVLAGDRPAGKTCVRSEACPKGLW